MKVLVTGSELGRLKKIKIRLEKEGFAVILTRNTLEALEIVKKDHIEAIICDREVQIGSSFRFPRWILDETGKLPPYFIFSEKLKEKSILQHENREIIAGIIKSLGEIKNLKDMINRIKKHLLPKYKGFIGVF